MNTLNYSIAEGKKNFSKIIKTSEEKNRRLLSPAGEILCQLLFPIRNIKKTGKKKP